MLSDTFYTFKSSFVPAKLSKEIQNLAVMKPDLYRVFFRFWYIKGKAIKYHFWAWSFKGFGVVMCFELDLNSLVFPTKRIMLIRSSIFLKASLPHAIITCVYSFAMNLWAPRLSIQVNYFKNSIHCCKWHVVTEHHRFEDLVFKVFLPFWYFLFVCFFAIRFTFSEYETDEDLHSVPVFSFFPKKTQS
jgi:hypothetical protein